VFPQLVSRLSPEPGDVLESVREPGYCSIVFPQA
jgi:hypothetical protein